MNRDRLNTANITDTTNNDPFNELYPALVSVFAVIFLGYLTGRLGLITPKEAQGFSKLAIYPTLPAFIFRAMATINFKTVEWMFVLAVTLSKLIVFVVVTMLTLLFTRDVGRAGVYSLFCTMSNDLALGIPILKPLYEKNHKDFLDCAYVLSSVNVALLLMIALIMMEFNYRRSRNKSANLKGIVLKTVQSIVTNPVVLASVSGIIVNFISKQKLPTYLDKPLMTLSNAFGGPALFFLGLSVVGKIRTKIGMITLVPLSLGIAKVIVLPLIIRGLCISFNIGGLKLREEWSTFGFLYGTIPPSSPTVFYAAHFGIEEDTMAFGMIMSTMFSAPVMLISSKMATVNNMNQTNVVYRDLLNKTRTDISIVSIILACWVIAILFLSRRFQSIPHRFTVCLAFSQLLLCISFVLIKSNPFIKCCRGFEAFLITTFIFATHCWTAIIAFILSSARCSVESQWNTKTRRICITGWALPAVCCGILVLILKPKIDEFPYKNKDFFAFINEKKVYVAFWLTLQVICIFVCVGSLLRMYRFDKYCKCEMVTEEDNAGDQTPLLSSSRKKCHRCVKDKQRGTTDDCTSVSIEMQDADEGFSVVHTRNRLSSQDCRQSKHIKLDKYYEGEQHQSGNHVVVIVSQVLVMCLCIFYCLWVLVGDDLTSGIFLEVELLISIILSAQVLVVFACFGFERTFLIDPLLQKLRCYWYGVDTLILPNINDLEPEEYHICQQFVRYHKENCLQALSSRPAEDGGTSYFYGCNLVDWLVRVGLVADRVTAVKYGNSLLKGRVIRHSENRYYFRDSTNTYNFCPDWDEHDHAIEME
ncbi:integral membrane protein GPR155-like isoform X1 [Xenia sp. Carnegie-2017]|uniref:integral membrane protein GPR155-like isoform X1 n=1 Tax=Xenia sp. Carnegie-2017 TaxID=2897299 RepID=UPI001F03FAF8|nr:integral membrane protein GPR155-like isoform X1 [Xenia sp. Carnegie-2017]